MGFCYLIAVNGHQKIGRSINVDGVLANARRFDASARLITCWPSLDSVHAEKILHSGLKRWRVENEQFQMPEDVIKWIASLDDREFAEWYYETDCDDRAIGWNFPRIFLHGETRMWASVFFPRTDVVAWAMIGSKTKPEYSLVENLWLQDSRGFNSVWMGRPQKFGGARPTDPVIGGLE